MNVQKERSISPPCIVCGSPAARLQTKPAALALWRCPHCTTDFVFPVPSEELLVSPDQNADQSEWTGEFLGRFEREGETLSLLDVGCGDGSRLAMALSRGWRCFGVEPSDTARASAQQRVGTMALLTDRVEHLIPLVFDVILLLDVLEHCPDPMRLFYALFTRGAIQPRTTVVISTAHAGLVDSSMRLLNRAGSQRFVSFSAESLKRMLAKLRFNQVTISSLRELAGEPARSLPNESSELDHLSGDTEIAAVASGSDFHAFMKERYVPGTWLDLSLYEHFPRYLLAAGLAQHKAVLDFGCGTGYGAAMLARKGAASVVGLDIDPATIEWAQHAHCEENLSFCVRTDLGAGLPAESFDLITCFEMIEHVTEPVQEATIASIARLLKRKGILVISTPNPVVTKLYGENPFHLREMTDQEFVTLLTKRFKHIQLNYQFIHEGVLIAPAAQAACTNARVESLRGTEARSPAAAFIAVCSNGPLPDIPVTDFVDNTDFIGPKVRTEYYINTLQLEHFAAFEAVARAQLQNHSHLLSEKEGEVHDLVFRNRQLRDLLAAREAKIRSLEASSLVRLERTIQEPWSLRKARKIGSLLVSIAKNSFRASLRGWRGEKSNATEVVPAGEPKHQSDGVSDKAT